MKIINITTATVKSVLAPVKGLWRILKLFFTFVVLLTLYFLHALVVKLYKNRYIPKGVTSRILSPFLTVSNNIIRKIDKNQPGKIRKLDLIELAIANMMAKKARTWITIGGVAIGFGSIVFLVSIGYGLQQLVISRVARLDELRQADVRSQPGSKVVFNDKTIPDFKVIPNVDTVLPLIAVAGKVTYQSSITDVAVYGVTSDYLKYSAIKPVTGAIFDSNDVSIHASAGENIAGAFDDNSEKEYGQEVSEVSFNIVPGEWVRVRSAPSSSSDLLGYYKRYTTSQKGKEVWGAFYETESEGKTAFDKEGNKLRKWVRAGLPLWTKENGEYVPLTDDAGIQVFSQGYIAEIEAVTIQPVSMPSVLGEMTESTTETTESTESGLSIISEDGDWVEISGESSAAQQTQVKEVVLGQGSVREAIVNRSLLTILNLNEADAVGKTFETKFIVTGNLLTEPGEKIESEVTSYKITGIIPDDTSPFFYVPLVDLRTLGIERFSQVKVVANSNDNLANVRKQIEALGYTTSSVADTVAQINSLFGTLRLVLSIMGMVALAVAALGMFNTFTVSLLERTREVGLMKAMGMKSTEVQELFLTESMIMGFFGGIGGLIFGVVVGKLLGLLLSLLAVFKGAGFIDVSYVPASFSILILLLSFILGVGTGVYPSLRAKKISALNALRYE